MKIIVLACLAAVAVATPQFEDRVVALLRDDRVANEDGTFSYAVEADNGINTAVEGVVGSAGQINQQGSYTYTLADRVVALLRDDRVANEDGTFSYALEADNGINTAVEGVVGSAGQINQAGSYTYTLADGTQAVVTFVANENGFQPQSSILPTPHPLPAHVFELLEIAERQRAAGIVFN
nr:cuticle protein AMP1A-like [Penaeus vannamei]